MKLVIQVVLLLICTHASLGAPALQQLEFKDPPLIGMTAKVNPLNASQEVRSDAVYFGGFSGITYDGPENGGRGFLFKINTNNGPTADPVTTVPGTQQGALPFALPSFVPRIISVLVNFDTKSVVMYEDISLLQGDGRNLTGLPNLQYGHQNLAYTDEFGVDLFGNIQPNDPEGADLEGIVRASDDTYWLGDDYRASLYHFDQNGKLLKRFIPQGNATSSGLYGVPVLPAVFAQRRNGRGFRGVAIQGDNLYAFLQSPLDNPNTINNTVSKTSSNIRILVFDTVKEKVLAEYVYVLGEGVKLPGESKVDKIGDVCSLGNGKFLVVEQDSSSGKDAFKGIYEIDITQATDIHDQAKIVFLLPPNKTIEEVDLLKETTIRPVTKKFIVNLASIGFAYTKVEGLTVFNSTSVVVVNNNDYQVVTNQFNDDGTLTFDRSQFSYIGLVTGLNFTSSYVTTSTTFTPTTTTSSSTTTTSGGSTTGKVTTSTTGGTTSGNTTTTTTSTSTTNRLTTTTTTTNRATTTTTTTTSTTTNSASSIAFALVQIIVCAIALALI